MSTPDSFVDWDDVNRISQRDVCRSCSVAAELGSGIGAEFCRPCFRAIAEGRKPYPEARKTAGELDGGGDQRERPRASREARAGQ